MDFKLIFWQQTTSELTLLSCDLEQVRFRCTKSISPDGKVYIANFSVHRGERPSS
jgi:hypothetical protein